MKSHRDQPPHGPHACLTSLTYITESHRQPPTAHGPRPTASSSSSAAQRLTADQPTPRSTGQSFAGTRPAANGQHQNSTTHWTIPYSADGGTYLPPKFQPPGQTRFVAPRPPANPRRLGPLSRPYWSANRVDRAAGVCSPWRARVKNRRLHVIYGPRLWGDCSHGRDPSVSAR